MRLSNLAVKLGETFMASDLTALLQLKKQTAPVRVADNKALQARVELEEQKPLNKNILEFRNSKGYIIKMLILNILAMVSSKPHAENYFDPPVNLVLTELVAARKNRFLVDDEEYRMRLFHVLAPYANKVEGKRTLIVSSYNNRSLFNLFQRRIDCIGAMRLTCCTLAAAD